MRNSTDPTVGNVLKEGVPFLHNFGSFNTFLGSGAGNFTMTGDSNTASGSDALYSNTTGYENTASGYRALFRNSTSVQNTATGYGALGANTIGDFNTATGHLALWSNTTGQDNTASAVNALSRNTTGNGNTAIGLGALFFNTTGSGNTAIGSAADVSTGDLTNATAIGFNAVVNASDKIRLGNSFVTVIEGQVPYTYTSDRNQKENLKPVEGEEALTKIRGLSLTSWHYIGQDAKQFRHYGPMAQDFFAAFGRDSVGTIGTPTTITSGDLDGILMIAAQALEKRTVEQKKEIDVVRAENVDLKARLEALERLVGNRVFCAAASTR